MISNIKRFRAMFILITTGCVSLAAAVFIAYSIGKNIYHKDNIIFKKAAEDRVQLIKEAMSKNTMMLNAATAFFHSSESVKRMEFAQFAGALLEKNPSLLALAWSPRVTRSEKAALEQKGKNFLFGFKITQRGENGGLVEARDTEEYYPAFYLEPYANNERILGFDFLSDPNRGQALREAMKTKSLAATGPVQLIRKDASTPGVILFSPVFYTNAFSTPDKEKLRGFVVTAIELNELFKATLGGLSSSNSNFLIYDVNSETPDVPFSTFTDGKSKSPEVINSLFEDPNVKKEEYNVAFANRAWKIVAFSNNPSHHPLMYFESLAALAASSIVVFLVMMFLLNEFRRHARVEKLVTKRTGQLKTTAENLRNSEARLKLAMQGTHDGIWDWDIANNKVYYSERFVELLGHDKKDFEPNFHAFSSRIHPDHRRQVIDSIMLHLNERIPFDIELKMQKKDSSYTWVQLRGKAIWDKNGKAVRMAGALSDITERKQLEEELRRRANYDELTGLANRSLFIGRLKRAISRAGRLSKKIGLVYVDLDNFKPVNDTLGHKAGDDLLSAFGERLEEAIRDYDTIARLGGDEFTIILDSINARADCEVAIQRILKHLEAPFSIEGKQINMEVSIGVALYPENGKDHDALLKSADEAMYVAKEEKGSTVSFAKNAEADDEAAREKA
jgi:diguanylate cyclase (GGDEF)-like protein/PAS domain S-box-containing protein